MLITHIIAVSSTAETALRAQAELLQTSWDNFCCFLDALDNGLLVLQLREFGRDKTENDGLAFWQEAERSEVSRPRIVKLQKVNVGIELAEENFSDRLVSAFCKMGRSAVCKRERASVRFSR